jgi:aconitate hydratase
MGVLPLQFLPGQNAESLGLTGKETFDIPTNGGKLKVGEIVNVTTNTGKKF